MNNKEIGRQGPDVRLMTAASLTAALIAACAQISIPLPLVPINLALLPVFVASMVLPRRWALISVGLYLLMGIAGLPVFSGFKGGPQILLGPTGGYLLGYFFAAGVLSSLSRRVRSTPARFLACIFSLLACYAPGTLWLMRLTGRGLDQALAAGVLPFIPGDLVKALAAALLVPIAREASGSISRPWIGPQ